MKMAGVTPPFSVAGGLRPRLCLGHVEPTPGTALKQHTVRRIDLLASLSLATDMALGQQREFALKSARLAVRLAKLAGAPGSDVGNVLYQSLLRYVGCNADTFIMSSLFGDEYALRREFSLIDMAKAGEVFGVILRSLRRRNAGASGVGMAVAIAQGFMQAQDTSKSVLAGHCEVAERVAARLGLGQAMQTCLGQLYERWDGRGIPRGLKGEAVAFPVRVVALAQDIVLLTEAFGSEKSRIMIAARKGSAHDPRLAAVALENFARLSGDLAEAVDPEEFRALEPRPPAMLDDTAIDEACLVIADMADMRMPHTLGHSRAVADLATAAARHMGLPAAEIRLCRRAALVHDIGEISVPVSVWMRGGSFSGAEHDQVRLHPYHSERILARAGGIFDSIAHVAARHHERLDGSGYFRGCRAHELSPASRILAAAEVWQNAIESRPHRSALQAGAAAARLRAMIRDGAICQDAGAAILAVAGQQAMRRTDAPANGLTAREIEVLRMLAQGNTARDVGLALSISRKTAANHVQNIYSKLNVTTRAAAVLFAVENGIHRAELE